MLFINLIIVANVQVIIAKRGVGEFSGESLFDFFSEFITDIDDGDIACLGLRKCADDAVAYPSDTSRHFRWDGMVYILSLSRMREKRTHLHRFCRSTRTRRGFLLQSWRKRTREKKEHVREVFAFIDFPTQSL